MQDIVIPGDLGRKCLALVKERKIPSRKRRHLSKLIVTRENMAAAASMPECRKVIERGGRLFRGRAVCNILGLVAIAAAVYFNWWLLLCLLPLIVVERLLANSEKEGWLFIAASLLALEILANDVAGWGTAKPELKKRALEALGVSQGGARTKWLDLFLPDRNGLDKATLDVLGPGSSSG